MIIDLPIVVYQVTLIYPLILLSASTVGDFVDFKSTLLLSRGEILSVTRPVLGMSRSLIPKRRTADVEADFPRYMSEIFGIHVAAIDANLVHAASLGIPETPTGPVRLGKFRQNHSPAWKALTS